SAGSFWAFRTAIFVGLPTETRAPVAAGDAWDACPAAWAAGSPADSASTTLPAAAPTRKRHFLPMFIGHSLGGLPIVRGDRRCTANGDAELKAGLHRKREDPGTEMLGSASPEDPHVRANSCN